MSEKYLKNIEYEAVLNYEEMVEYQDGQIVSRTIVQNKNHNITLFAFDKGEEISSHSSSGDAIITVLDGKALVTIGDNKYSVSKNQTIVMPNNVPHAVEAEEKFKMTLTVIFN